MAPLPDSETKPAGHDPAKKAGPLGFPQTVAYLEIYSSPLAAASLNYQPELEPLIDHSTNAQSGYRKRQS